MRFSSLHSGLVCACNVNLSSCSTGSQQGVACQLKHAESRAGYDCSHMRCIECPAVTQLPWCSAPACTRPVLPGRTCGWGHVQHASTDGQVLDAQGLAHLKSACDGRWACHQRSA